MPKDPLAPLNPLGFVGIPGAPIIIIIIQFWNSHLVFRFWDRLVSLRPLPSNFGTPLGSPWGEKQILKQPGTFLQAALCPLDTSDPSHVPISCEAFPFVRLS